MQDNQRDAEYLENRGDHHGGYAGKNQGGGNYRGRRGGNTPRGRGSSRAAKGRNSGRGGEKSSFAPPEIRRAVYLVACIPLTVIGLLVGYFTGAAYGVWS